MAYGYIDPVAFEQMNPAQKNDAALRAGYTGKEDYYDQQRYAASSGGGGPDDFLASLKSELTAQMDKMNARLKEFDTNNPFSFDEAQAEASAAERFNPYYDAELKDFVSGIDRQRESAQGERQLLVDLNRIQVGKDARAMDDALSASEEGYAGAGLFFSGARERASGRTLIEGADAAAARDREFGYNLGQNDRTLAGVEDSRATGLRRLGAQKTTDIQTEIEKQRAEEQARWHTERAQYVGYPYTQSVSGGLNQFMLNAFS